MAERDLSLISRAEDTVEQRPINAPVKFSLLEIKQHFDETLSSVKDQSLIADALIQEGKIEEGKTVWRSQIVFLEGLLDFYIHEISKYALYQMFCGEWTKSEQYHSFKVSMDQLETAVASPESKTWFFNFLNGSFAKKVFLGAEEMKNQLNLIGVGFSNVMHRAFRKATINDSHEYGFQIVKTYYERRNKIAHQNDRDHATAVQNDITREYVEQFSHNIELIVTAIHSIANEFDNS